MPKLTVADALRLAINALRDSAESHRMPSGVELDDATADFMRVRPMCSKRRSST